MTPKTIAVLVGSLRKESYNRKMAQVLMKLAPESLKLEIVEIGGLPLYNEDLEKDVPKAWADFREHIKKSDGLLFVTPEYNRSIPGVLKNAIDVGSKPLGKNVWDARPGAVISVSPGAMGGFGANHHLRQCLMAVNVPTMAHPEAYIGGAAKLFDSKGHLTNEDTQKYVQKFVDSYVRWFESNSSNKA